MTLQRTDLEERLPAFTRDKKIGTESDRDANA